MSTANLVMILAFGAFVLLGLAAQALVDLRKQQPAYRVRERLRTSLHSDVDPSRRQVLAQLQRAQADARRRLRREKMGTVGYYLNRLETFSGRTGLRLLIIAGAASLLGPALGFASGLLPNHAVIVIVCLVSIPTLVMWLTYRKLEARFRDRFLAQLPDAVDMIVRASQAGIPTVQSIRTVGERFDSPLGPEFRRMGDSLLLGNDMEEVLDDAVVRIEMPDFSFLSVCLLLQRETGGSLAETLENLSNIIRSRRDLRLKTRALTAEGRMSGALLAVLPFCIIGILLAINPGYIGVMFHDPSGQKMLWIAGVMLFIGIAMIRKIARLEA